MANDRPIRAEHRAYPNRTAPRSCLLTHSHPRAGRPHVRSPPMRRVPPLLLALATTTLAAHGPPPTAASPPGASGWRPPGPRAVARPVRDGRDPLRRGRPPGADLAPPAGA